MRAHSSSVGDYFPSKVNLAASPLAAYFNVSYHGTYKVVTDYRYPPAVTSYVLSQARAAGRAAALPPLLSPPHPTPHSAARPCPTPPRCWAPRRG